MVAVVSSAPAPAHQVHEIASDRSHLRLVEPTRRPARRSEVTYRRRRFVAALVAIAVLVGLVWVAEAIIASVVPEVASSGPTVVETASDPAALATGDFAVARDFVVAQPGDTLWTIARQLQPQGDLRPLVQALSELNGGPAVAVGQAIRLP